MKQRSTLQLGPHRAAVDERLRRWDGDNFTYRLWARDPTLWASAGTAELADRLGWLNLPARMELESERLLGFADRVRHEDVDRVVLLGMGGSSLAAEVFARTFGVRDGFPVLEVADSSHPDAVALLLQRIDPARTLFVVSSKSGGTVETLSLFRLFWSRAEAIGPRPGDRFVAITDPGSSLETLGRERRFREIFGGPPDVGGRYSALSVFGLVPAALIGLDIDRLLGHARAMAVACATPDGNPGVELGAVLAELARAGRDKLTVVTSPGLAAFPDWLEQLVAESTGKEGRGLVPVLGEALPEPGSCGDDRVFVELALAAEAEDQRDAELAALAAAGHPVIRTALESPFQLGGEIFRWEVAVAAASAALGVHPFDQPDVQLAKELARRAMDTGVPDTHGGEEDPDARTAKLTGFLEQVEGRDYLAVQAFLAPTDGVRRRLAELQRCLGERTGVAVTVGFGPRFLHSTGQLHKGGPATCLCLQLTDRPATDVEIPEAGASFARLVACQARGDLEALQQRGRRALRLDLGDDPEVALEQLVDDLG